MRVGTLVDDFFGAPPCRPDLRIQRISLFGTHAFDVVLGMVDVPDVRHDTADRSAVFETAYRRSVRDADVCIAEEISAPPETVNEPGAVHVRRICVAVNIYLYGSIHGDNEKPRDDLGAVR